MSAIKLSSLLPKDVVFNYESAMKGHNEIIRLAASGYLQYLNRKEKNALFNAFYDSDYCKYDNDKELDMFIYNEYVAKSLSIYG